MKYNPGGKKSAAEIDEVCQEGKWEVTWFSLSLHQQADKQGVFFILLVSLQVLRMAKVKVVRFLSKQLALAE